MMIKIIENNLTPLCCMSDGTLLCYKNGDIFILRDGRLQNRFVLFKSRKERIWGKIKLIHRLLRLGVRATEAVDNTKVVFSVKNMLYELNIETGELSKGYYCGEGIRPLIFSSVKNVCGFDDGVYFGGYLGNDNKKPVSIYHRTDVDNWEVVYTFPEGMINHVHNIVPDSYRNCLWVFTGDFGEASAIWKVTDHFKNVERVAYNDQKFRGCVIYALPEGLLYATDTPIANNYIYLLDPEKNNLKALFPIDGSCIYGCRWKDNFVFSSAVEGCFDPSWSRLRWMVTRKRGGGIKDNFLHIYIGNLKDGFKEIYKEEKDIMPFYTFHFGVFKFPYGVNNTNTLYFQPVATKKHDLDLIALTL